MYHFVIIVMHLASSTELLLRGCSNVLKRAIICFSTVKKHDEFIAPLSLNAARIADDFDVLL